MVTKVTRKKKATIRKKPIKAKRRVTKKKAVSRISKKTAVKRVKKVAVKRNPCKCAKNPARRGSTVADHLIISVAKSDMLPKMRKAKMFDGRAYWDGITWTRSKNNAARYHAQTQAKKLAQLISEKRTLHDERFRTIYVAKDLDHPKTKGERKRNPVPPSKNAKVLKAIRLYEDFTGHTPRFVDTVDFQIPNTVLKVGKVDGILYTTVRDGKTEKYIHKFKARSRPLLLSAFDGKQLVIFGGRYQFTDRGIIDK